MQRKKPQDKYVAIRLTPLQHQLLMKRLNDAPASEWNAREVVHWLKVVDIIREAAKV